MQQDDFFRQYRASRSKDHDVRWEEDDREFSLRLENLYDQGNQLTIKALWVVSRIKGRPNWREYNIPGRTITIRAAKNPLVKENGDIVIGHMGKVEYTITTNIVRPGEILRDDLPTAMRT